MPNCLLTTCLLLAIVQVGNLVTAEERVSRLHLGISAWLR